MNRLMEQLPAYYRRIREFRELTKVQSEQLDLLGKTMQQLEDDQFIVTASEDALYRREREFSIIPDPQTETLEFRKKRLLNRMMRKAPFTFRYMIQQLDELVGIGQYVVHINITNYELEVLVRAQSSSYYKEAAEFLERTVPLNLFLETGVLADQFRVVIKAKEYAFGVPYPVTNTFNTSSVNGIGDKAATVSDTKIYDFLVPYPVTGTFYCSEGGY